VKAAVLHAPGAPLSIEEVTLSAPQAGEVLLRVAASGVCRSDHHVMTGATPHPMPVVCGHEGAGVVEQVGTGVTRVTPGDHVVLSWAPACGACFYCAHGLPAQCDTYLDPIWAGTMLDGTTRLGGTAGPIHHFSALATFAERTVVPESCCVPVRRDVPLEVAALVGCCVATGFCAARTRAKVQAGSRAAVFGCGGVGLNIIQGAALAGASRVIAVDVSAAKLRAARRFGATEAVDASREDPVAAVRRLTEGLGADYTFEAIGEPAVMAQAIAAARRGGTIVLVGLGPRAGMLPLGAGTFTREDKVLTSAYYGGCVPERDFPRILGLYAAGGLNLDDLITRRRPLEEINEAFADLISGEVIRTVITF
jgi:S-(hydroxymethyl)glutathione dehydrogenase/alcohol dehydrogenase